jgi:hypothetical protein
MLCLDWYYFYFFLRKMLPVALWRHKIRASYAVIEFKCKNPRACHSQQRRSSSFWPSEASFYHVVKQQISQPWNYSFVRISSGSQRRALEPLNSATLHVSWLDYLSLVLVRPFLSKLLRWSFNYLCGFLVEFSKSVSYFRNYVKEGGTRKAESSKGAPQVTPSY